MAAHLEGSAYPGPERRRHCVYVTRNTEYHFRDRVCVAVRERSTGHWLVAHSTLQRAVSGAVRFDSTGCAYPALAEPRIGDALFFAAGGPDVVTSLLLSIERPPKSVVTAYPP